MSELRSTLFKVLVKEFYRINAGFFLIVVGICFGFLRDVEHLALAHYFTSSVFLLLIPFLVWILYALKVISFNSLALRKQENEFLFALAAVETLKLGPLFVIVALWQFIPAIAYGVFLISLTVQQGSIEITAWTAIFLLFPCVCITALLYRKIKHPDPGVTISSLRRKVNSWFAKPFILFYPEWITARQPVLMIGTKVLACTMIIAISWLYQFDRYDERFFTMGCSLAFSFNLVLVFHYHRFENFHFSFIRSLPLSYVQRLLYFILVWTMIMFAEIGVIINYFPTGLSGFQIIPIMAFGVSTGILGYGLLFIRDINLEGYIQYVFWISLTWIVLILFKMPAMVLAIIQISLGIAVYIKNYYRFEFNAELGSEK